MTHYLPAAVEKIRQSIYTPAEAEKSSRAHSSLGKIGSVVRPVTRSQPLKKSAKERKK
jgi:hypothetical protein